MADGTCALPVRPGVVQAGGRIGASANSGARLDDGAAEGVRLDMGAHCLETAGGVDVWHRHREPLRRSELIGWMYGSRAAVVVGPSCKEMSSANEMPPLTMPGHGTC